MPRPRKVEITLKEKLRRIREAGLNEPVEKPVVSESTEEGMPTLNERIRNILQIMKAKPLKSTEVLYLVMYDIEDDKIRTLIAKYLLQKGCIRVQKSVYFARTKPKVFEEINTTLKEVQAAYDNQDSVLLVPVHSQAAGNIRIIGKDIQIEALIDAPNTLFF